ncbi:hypothetical protein [Tessaracoccus lapidicaptus]|uniref:hypothetical protein n=1 Tax=Tessaracoccus lapidicaptus TaxID=1427523 RepID=UPI00333FC64F
MLSPQLHAVGFDAESLDQLVKAAFDAGVRGVDSAPGFDLVGSYSDPSGARLSFVKRTGQGVSTTGALAAETRYRAQVVRFTDLLARVALYGPESPGPLLAQFVALVDDPVAYPQHDLAPGGQYSVVEDLRVGALAIEVTVYDDAAAFEASPEAAPGGDLRIAADALISPSLLALQAAAIPPQEASPALLMGVEVTAVERRRNELTGAEFQYVTGRGAVEITCAVPAETPLEVGNVVHGTWYATCSSGIWD